jgi:putative membrane protein
MGVGFAVSRFGLFLREMRASDTHSVVHATGLSVVSGVALVALGVLVNLAAVIHHVRTVKQLQSGTWVSGVSRNAVVLAVILVVVGVAMGAYLIYLR